MLQILKDLEEVLLIKLHAVLRNLLITIMKVRLILTWMLISFTTSSKLMHGALYCTLCQLYSSVGCYYMLYLSHASDDQCLHELIVS